MIQGRVIRGTTPTHEFELPYTPDFIDDIRVTYGQNKKPVFTKNKNQCILEDNKLTIELTQEDTFAFKPEKNVYVEIRIKLFNGEVVTTEEPIILRVVDTMDEEVMK